jgi:hypothetical protein
VIELVAAAVSRTRPKSTEGGVEAASTGSLACRWNADSRGLQRQQPGVLRSDHEGVGNTSGDDRDPAGRQGLFVTVQIQQISPSST